MPEPYRKKMIEVALPLDAINKASAREKSIRHGHPSTLHLWWARRPLAACRAVLFASLVDDPDSDPMYMHDEDLAASKRAELFNLIEDLVKWENSNNEEVINRARKEIARCVASLKLERKELQKDQIVAGSATAWNIKHMHAGPEDVNTFLAKHAPPVLDPFCGGGSIPLEAQRLGLRAYGSDLNPVPVLITKALIEIPPKFANMPPVNPESRKQGKLTQTWKGAQGLAEDVRYYGKWMRDEAEKRIGHLYPKVKITKEMAKDRPDLKEYVGEELTVIAWLWARTVASPNPAVGGAHVPLVRSYWLSNKKGKEAWIEPLIDPTKNEYSFVVRRSVPTDIQNVDAGTKIGRGCNFKCLLSGQPIPADHVKQLGVQGELSSRLLAIVVETQAGRVYVSPTREHEMLAVVDRPKSLGSVDAAISLDKRAIWCLLYGLDRFDKLFTARQLQMLTTFSDLVEDVRRRVCGDALGDVRLPRDSLPLESGGTGHGAYADAVAVYLALGIDKLLDYNCALVTWIKQRDQAGHAFTKQGIPMVWDYTEVNPFVGAAGDLDVSLSGICKVISASPSAPRAIVRQLDATAGSSNIPSPLISTDPPYYDNIGYADLSDFFYVWLRRSLSPILPSLHSTVLTPKSLELIASPYRHDGSSEKAQSFFEQGFAKAFRNLRGATNPDVPLTIYYGFKQSEADDTNDDDNSSESGNASTGWETMLSGVITAGFTVDGTWPMRTERSTRSVGMGTNALASSIILVCRARPTDAPLATRREFLSRLKDELPDALRHLQQGSIAPVDLAQAAIGPGMAVFTRYAKVMEADGSPMRVRTALALINQTLDEVLAEQEGEFDGDTRWALAWFEQFGMDAGPFGVAETLSKAKNTAVNALVEAGVITARAGKVKLVPRDQLPADWNPGADKRLTVWEIAQHLIHRHHEQGEESAAELMQQLGDLAETARDLAYRLYHLCERKKWADEALAYNALVIAWPELTKLARTARTPQPEQKEMF